MIEILSSYTISLLNTILEFEDYYEDPYYNTQVSIQDDFTATVEQFKIHGLLQFKRYKAAPESRTKNLSQYEVLECLSKIIIPYLENYLNKMKDGILKLQKLGATDSTAIEALGLVQLIHNKGESIYEKYIEKIKQGHSELEDMFVFVNNFKDYLSIFSDYDVFRRFSEFPIRMGFEGIMPNKRGRPQKNIGLDKKLEFYFQHHPNWFKSKSMWKEMADAIQFETDAKERGRALRDYLRKYHKKLFRKSTRNKII